MSRRALLLSVFAVVFLLGGTFFFMHIRGGLQGQTLPACDPNACAGDGQSVACEYSGGMGQGQLQCCSGLYEGAGECHSGCTIVNGNYQCSCGAHQTCTFPAETNNGVSISISCPAGYVVHIVDAYETVPNIPFNNANNCPAAEFNADGSVRHYECPGVCTNPPTISSQENKNPATFSYYTFGNCGDPVVGCWKYGYTIVQCVGSPGNTAIKSCQPYCGDGVVDNGEVCDEGFIYNGTYGHCNINCTGILKCGDGVKSGPEECDDGSNNGADKKCSTQCTQTYCGDGVVQKPDGKQGWNEQCDDGAKNGTAGDSCQTNCQLQSSSSSVTGIRPNHCGNKIVEPSEGEQCDDGLLNGYPGDPCTQDCKLAPICPYQKGVEIDTGAILSYVTLCQQQCSGAAGNQCCPYSIWFGPGDTAQCACMPPAKPHPVDPVALPRDQIQQAYNECAHKVCVDNGMVPAFICSYACTANASDMCSCECIPQTGICNNNHVCELGETADSCPIDCGGPTCDPVGLKCPASSSSASSRSSATSSACNIDAVCTPTECGPPIESPNFICPDGKSAGGPKCVRDPATCGCKWIEQTCSSASSSSTSACTIQECGPPPEMADMICPDGKPAGGAVCKRDDTGTCKWIRQACSSASATSASSTSSIVPIGLGSSSSSASVTVQASSASASASASRQSSSVSTLCGNGVVDPGEQCDDGNNVNTDGCTNACTIPYCGDGIVSLSEQCDNGPQNSNGPGACRPNCKLPRCGDAIIDPNEQCDDGNNVSGDGCSATCTLENIALASSSTSSALETSTGYCCIGGSCLGSPDCGLSLPQCRTSCTATSSVSSVFLENGCSATACQDGGNDFCGSQGKVCVTDSQLPCMRCITASSVSSLPEFPGCVTNADCDPGASCINGNCTPCSSDMQCLLGKCVNGNCSYCTTDAACPAGEQCKLGRCVASSSSSSQRSVAGCIDDAGCLAGQTCVQGRCISASSSTASSKHSLIIAQAASSKPGCVTTADCVNGGICVNGSCSQCTNDAQCLSNLCVAGHCVRCVSDAACSPGQRCVQGACVPGSSYLPVYCGNGKLDPGEQCDDGAKNSNNPNAFCRPDCTLGRCGDGILDPQTESCDDGARNGTAGDSCDANCHPVHPSTQVLPANVLQLPLSPGNPLCTSDAQCASGQHCLNGQCISSGCQTNVDCAAGMQCLNGQCVASVQYGQQPHAPVGKTGPATLAIMAAGASAGYAYMRRKKRRE